MASPFDKFRKNQKKLLAFLGVVCMVAFVFGSVTCQPSGPRGNVANAPVVEIHNTTYREYDIDALRKSRQLANQFVAAVAGEAGQRMPQAPFGSASEESVVDALLLAEKAQSMGMVVSDQAINDFIAEITAGRLTNQTIQAIVAKQGTSARQVFDSLRTELLASNMLQNMLPREFMQGATPAERWDLYLRVHRRAYISVLPVYVKDFTGKTHAVSDEELQRFFNEYKDRLPDPNSPTPGFRKPAEASFEFVFADFNKFYEQALAKVTPEEISKYYEEHKDTFPYSGLDEPATSSSPLTAPEEDPLAKPGEEEGAADGDKTKPSDTGSDSSQDQKKNPPASKPGDGAQLDDAQPTFEVAFQDKQKSPEPGQAQAPAGSAKSADNAESTKTGEGKPDEGKPSEGKPSEGKPGDANLELLKPGEEPLTPAGRESSKEKPAEAAPVKSLQEILNDFRIPKKISGGQNPPHDPLWKVEETIRKQLARKAAEGQIAGVFDEVRQKMERYQNEWISWDALKDEGHPQPKEPDLRSFAELNGMEFYSTGKLATAKQLADSKDERVKAFANSTVEGVQGSFPVRQLGYSSTVTRFQPFVSEDADRNRYLLWRADEKFMTAEESVPKSFDEVKNDVRASWKMVEARDFALNRAKQIAEEVRRSSKTLLDVQENDARAKTVPPFTWLSQQSLFSMQLEPNQVEGVEKVGERFMREVANLEPGDLGVAMNQPEDIAYVIQLIKVDYVNQGRAVSKAIIESDFRTSVEQGFFLYQRIAEMDRFELMHDLIDRVKQEASVKWLREPRQFQR